jgi:hypothetical protein
MPGGLSLWLVPEEPERARLEALIRALAQRLGTPPFAPHVTLLGGIGLAAPEARERARELARGPGSLALQLTHAAHADEFYRCVVLEALPSDALLRAHEAARQALGGGPGSYRPHLSLVYGRLPAAFREALVGEVEGTLPLPLATNAAHLELLATAGPPARWSRIAGFDLK